MTMGSRFVTWTGRYPRIIAGRLMAPLRGRAAGKPLGHDIDCLVYSSHKSGTQTLTATLEQSGISARHIHHLRNAGMDSGCGAFGSYLEQYRRRNGRRLNIVSTFRLPLERNSARLNASPDRVGVCLRRTARARSGTWIRYFPGTNVRGFAKIDSYRERTTRPNG
jgi:hypothetical protein